MAASYKKLFKMLIDREMKSKDLAAKAGISPATLAKMKKDGATVSSDVLVKICTALECTLDDIVEIIPDLGVWDKNVPVEKSAYLRDNEIKYLNVENFKFDPKKLVMLDLFCGAGGFAVGCGWAGFQSVLGVDHFEPAMKTWCRNHPNSILENVRLLSDKFDIVPLLYGSLGLEYLTGDDLGADDIDILVSRVFITDRWQEFKAVFPEGQV